MDEGMCLSHHMIVDIRVYIRESLNSTLFAVLFNVQILGTNIQFSDHMNKIKSAMSGFHLPGCQVPDWARVVAEEEWKTQLLTRLHQRVSLIHSPPSSHDGTECSDPPSKRPKCGLEQDEEEMSDEENSSGEGTSVRQTDNETDQR